MSTTKRKASGDTFRVAEPMDESGRMTVRPVGRFTEYEIVAYADDIVRERLSGLSSGEPARLDLTTVDGREDAYVVTRYLPGSLTGL